MRMRMRESKRGREGGRGREREGERERGREGGRERTRDRDTETQRDRRDKERDRRFLAQSETRGEGAGKGGLLLSPPIPRTVILDVIHPRTKAEVSIARWNRVAHHCRLCRYVPTTPHDTRYTRRFVDRFHLSLPPPLCESTSAPSRQNIHSSSSVLCIWPTRRYEPSQDDKPAG